MDIRSLFPADPAFETNEFLSALHRAQVLYGKTHEAVQAALDEVDPHFALAVEKNFEVAADVVSQVKAAVDQQGAWA